MKDDFWQGPDKKKNKVAVRAASFGPNLRFLSFTRILLRICHDRTSSFLYIITSWETHFGTGRSHKQHLRPVY